MSYPVLFITLLLSLLSVSSFSYADTVSEDPLERRALDIGKTLRCAVCQNQPISESNSGLAKDMMAVIKEQLQKGKSEREIEDYFVARYGDYVLMKPRQQGIGLPLWLIPPFLLIIIGSVAFIFLRSRTLKVPGRPKKLTDEEKARIKKEREKNKHDKD